MLYKFDNDKYELCKKYIMEVYDGNKKNVEMYDVSKSIIVSGNSVNDFMDAADYAIIHFGMINQDYLSDLGCKLQFLYDDIYRQTKINKKSAITLDDIWYDTISQCICMILGTLVPLVCS